jgi:galactose mutarotase-like enzyme
MKISHSEEIREDRHLDTLTDEQNGVRIIVSRLGAELVSLARINEAGKWTGFLYRDNDLSTPAQGWANHATVMGYYLHRLKNGHSFYRGREIKGGNHGFLRSKTWRLVESSVGDGASLKYQITPEDFSSSEYPLKVSVSLTYKLDTNKVSVIFEFQNHEPELTAHVAFGLHPGFAATSFESFHLQMPKGLFAGQLSVRGNSRHRIRRWRNAVFKAGIAWFDHPRTDRCSAAKFLLCRSAERPVGDSGP